MLLRCFVINMWWTITRFSILIGWVFLSSVGNENICWLRVARCYAFPWIPAHSLAGSLSVHFPVSGLPFAAALLFFLVSIYDKSPFIAFIVLLNMYFLYIALLTSFSELPSHTINSINHTRRRTNCYRFLIVVGQLPKAIQVPTSAKVRLTLILRKNIFKSAAGEM